MRSERVVCPECGKGVAWQTPKGGDGSAVKLYRHHTGHGSPPPTCVGSGRVYVGLELADS